MNYKIRITAENQAIVKRIADENGMNPNNWSFDNFNKFYILSDNKFIDIGNDKSHTELTTEQFIEMFDKKETELDKWLKETKAKNLSLEDLGYLTGSMDHFLYIRLREKFNLNHGDSLADFLFNQWGNLTEETAKVETQWQPKRGDRVLVWDDVESAAKERIFLSEIEGSWFPIIVVATNEEYKFIQGEEFLTSAYRQMKPLPIEQPKETDFKSKFEAAIELIENEIKALENKRDYAVKDKLYQIASGLVSEIAQATKLLNKIKELK